MNGDMIGTVGIICALKAEAEHLEKYMQKKQQRNVLGIGYTSGLLCNKPVVIAVCGAGKVAAAVCAQTMILLFSPSLLINTGVAGALSPELSVFDIVVAQDVVQHDFDTSPCGDPVGYITAIGRREMKCDAKASELLASCSYQLGYNTFRGRIATGDRFVEGEKDRLALRKLTGAIACEMEGGAVAQTALMAQGLQYHGNAGEDETDGENSTGVPFCIVRAVSDSGNGMEFGKFLSEAARRSAAVIAEYLGRM